jgi:hypothetical protein
MPEAFEDFDHAHGHIGITGINKAGGEERYAHGMDD